MKCWKRQWSEVKWREFSRWWNVEKGSEVKWSEGNLLGDEMLKKAVKWSEVKGIYSVMKCWKRERKELKWSVVRWGFCGVSVAFVVKCECYCTACRFTVCIIVLKLFVLCFLLQFCVLRPLWCFNRFKLLLRSLFSFYCFICYNGNINFPFQQFCLQFLRFPRNSPYIPRGYLQFPKSLSVKPSRVVILSVGPLLPFEDFTSSVCCPLDGLPARRKLSLVVGLSPWCL